MSLKGKVVVITGGGTGMGADAAKASRAAGASVVLNGRREDKLAEVASSVDPTGKNVAYVAGDIGDPEIGVRLIKTASDKFGGVDVLFNNAGVFAIKPFPQVTRDDLREYFNLMNPTRSTRGATSLSSSTHFPPIDISQLANPVRLPVGRASLLT